MFDQQYEFIARTRPEAFLISVLTSFPGTRRTLKPRKNMLLFLHQNFGFRSAWRNLERAQLAKLQS